MEPEGLLGQTAVPVGGSRAWPGFEMTRRSPAVWRAPVEAHGLLSLAAAPVGGGRAWPGFEIDHSEPKARVWRSRGRAAAYGRTKQPGPATPTPPAPGKQPGHRATSTTMGAQAAAHGRTTQPGPARPPTGVNDQTIR